MLKYILLITLINVLITTACVEIKNMDEPKRSAATASTANKLTNLNYDVLDGNGVNQFSIQLHIPEGVFLLVRKNETDIIDYQVAVNKTYIDNNVQAGARYTYQLGYLREEDFIPLQEVHLQVPFDLYVRGQLSLTGAKQTQILENLRLLYFVNNAELVTNGNPIHIKAKKIISNNGKIMTFVPGASAQVGQIGRSGGDITIESENADGILSVEMRGENGSPGSTAADLGEGPAQSGNPGNPGLPGGSSGTLHLLLPTQIKVEVAHQPGSGGPGGPGGNGTKYIHCPRLPRGGEFEFLPCERIGPRGPDGPQGPSGEMGVTCILNHKGKEDCH